MKLMPRAICNVAFLAASLVNLWFGSSTAQAFNALGMVPVQHFGPGVDCVACLNAQSTHEIPMPNNAIHEFQGIQTSLEHLSESSRAINAALTRVGGAGTGFTRPQVGTVTGGAALPNVVQTPNAAQTPVKQPVPETIKVPTAPNYPFVQPQIQTVPKLMERKGPTLRFI